jgi:hypothetical protein
MTTFDLHCHPTLKSSMYDPLLLQCSFSQVEGRTAEFVGSKIQQWGKVDLLIGF